MIANPSSFINTLKEFGKRIGKVTKRQIDTVKEIIDNKDFEFDRMYEISKSAHNLLLWLKAMVKLYDVHKERAIEEEGGGNGEDHKGEEGLTGGY